MCSSKEVCFTCLGKNSINDEMIELKKPDLDGIPYITKLKKCVRGLQVCKHSGGFVGFFFENVCLFCSTVVQRRFVWNVWNVYASPIILERRFCYHRN